MARITLGDQIKFLGDFIGVLTKNTIQPTEKEIDMPGSERNGAKSSRRVDYGISTGAGVGYEISEDLLLSVLVRNNLGLYATNSTNFLVGIDYCFGSRE